MLIALGWPGNVCFYLRLTPLTAHSSKPQWCTATVRAPHSSASEGCSDSPHSRLHLILHWGWIGKLNWCEREREVEGKEQGIWCKANLSWRFGSDIYELQRRRQFGFSLFMQIIQGKTELRAIWICKAPHTLAFYPLCNANMMHDTRLHALCVPGGLKRNIH